MLLSRHVVRIEWGDCDAAGIVFYPRYFQFFDAATTRLIELAGYSHRELQRRFDIVGWPIVDARATFFAPATYGDDIAIETKIVAFRRSSFDVTHRAFNLSREDAPAMIEAHETRVWTGRDPDDATRLKSRPIPEEVKERLSGG